MKPTVSKVKNMRGRITGYEARIGEVTAEGSTPAEATERCERSVLATLMRLDCGAIVGGWRGHTYFVAPTLHGWEYWIDTFTRLDYSVRREGTREEVKNNALHHLAQNVWDHDVADDREFVAGLPGEIAKEILGWISFQRSYLALKAEGKTDEECHRLACRTASVTEASVSP